ncbi:VWA domain-containing protein [Hyphococcus sp.]|uniref:VWA domain-containing protein n=1 Tax=Hyphococcus sp. TaxID=2038636 RepID=UPI0035C740F8
MAARAIRLFISAIALFFIALPAAAQEGAGDSILVLDGSGSMWGQIEGEAKITIAKSVLAELLNDLPAERRLGLIAYGHRRTGDCADIEELAAVGADRAAIADAVQKLNPKGKTPMADSIKLAAEKLKYTEAKSTVILISDGIETCAPDPCGVASALEEAGADFTVHVVGFDVTEENAEAQLRCIAENTGGKYVSASDAGELTEALEETVAAAPEAVTETKVRLRATELEGGPVIEEGLSWTVTPAGGGDPVFSEDGAGVVDVEIEPGTYDVAVSRASDGLKGEAKSVRINANTWKTVTIALTFPVEATLRAEPAGEAVAGTNVQVFWTGPDRRGDFITIVEKGADRGQYGPYAYTRTGNPVEIRMPVDPGAYEIRYRLGQPIRTLASIDITAIPAEATLEGPDTAIAGEEITVAFTGPAAGSGDWITVVKPDDEPNKYSDYYYTRQGSPATIRVPLEAGAYELRFVQGGKKIIARQPITVTAATATLSAKDTAIAGETVSVEFTGPAPASGDWITVTAPDAAPNKYTDYHYTRNGSPAEIRMPLDAGDYEIRFVQNNKKVLARKPITVTEATATLNGPSSAKAGETVDVAFTGPPPGSGDYVAISKMGSDDLNYVSYSYTRNGSPARLRMPNEPGEYELRFIHGNKKVLARAPITVTP